MKREFSEIYMGFLLSILCGIPACELIDKDYSDDIVIQNIIAEAMNYHIDTLNLDRNEYLGDDASLNLSVLVTDILHKKVSPPKIYTHKEIENMRIEMSKELDTPIKEIVRTTGLDRNTVRKLRRN